MHCPAVLRLSTYLLPVIVSLPLAGHSSAQLQDAQSFLQEALEQSNLKTQFPGMAAALIENGELVATAVTGFRSMGGEDAVQLNDRFHIGSVSKSFTATMIGRLVELGRLRWDLTIADGLPGIEVANAYAQCTLLELLRHRAGLLPYTQFSEAEEAASDALKGNPTEVRRQFVARALQCDGTPRGGFAYSNAGYSVAGLMAEVATGSSWRELIQTHVFDPLGMEESGFGWPAQSETSPQPFGHWGEPGGPFTKVAVDEYELGAYIAPAGDLHCSAKDLAKYTLAHMQGIQGLDGILKAETFAILHTPSTKPGRMLYAAGWMIAGRNQEHENHAHNGSAGSFYTSVQIYPLQDRALLIMVNAADFTEQSVKLLKQAAAKRFQRMIESE